jgi:hypothetical protein
MTRAGSFESAVASSLVEALSSVAHVFPQSPVYNDSVLLIMHMPSGRSTCARSKSWL